jgi:LemA protein
MTIVYVILGIIAILLLFVISTYNGLAKARQKVKEALGEIDSQLKRRFDLIPNLVETVKGYAKHEKDLLEKVTELRTSTVNPNQSVEERAAASNMLSNTLRTVFAVAENYPDLKANQNFIQLQENLNQIESDIQNSRRYYNGAVKEFNNKIVVFPNVIFAGMLGFREEKYFEASETEKENVKVQF